MPLLYDLVDSLYNGVMRHMPEALQERPLACAFTLGVAGAYAAIRGLQFASRHLVNKVRPKFHEDILPTLEKICVAGMAAAPVAYALIDPQGAQEIMTQHPAYTSGMAGVYVGSIGAALQDLSKRKE